MSSLYAKRFNVQVVGFSDACPAKIYTDLLEFFKGDLFSDGSEDRALFQACHMVRYMDDNFDIFLISEDQSKPAIMEKIQLYNVLKAELHDLQLAAEKDRRPVYIDMKG